MNHPLRPPASFRLKYSAKKRRYTGKNRKVASMEMDPENERNWEGTGAKDGGIVIRIRGSKMTERRGYVRLPFT